MSENKQQNNQDKVQEAVDSTEKKRKARNWTIFALLLIILAIFFYFQCAPTSKSITASDVTYSNTTTPTDPGTLTVTDTNNNKYDVKGNGVKEWEKNSYASLYYSAGIQKSWTFYALTNHGKISFRVTERDVTVNNNTVAMWTIGTKDANEFAGDANAPFAQWLSYATTTNSTLPDQSTPAWYYVLQFAPTILFLVLMFYMWKKMGAGGGMGGSGDDNVFSIGKSQAKVALSNIKFNDVAGIEEEKEELIEIVDYLKNPAKYSAMGARTPKGVILYGPPGTGKTLLAKAVAGEAKVPFFQVSGSAFDDMLVGVGAKRVRDLFAKARKVSPAIIFIDEIDSVASKRGKFDMSGGGGVADQTINQLLAEMDGFSTKTGIVVMAATNRLDVLDDAILRPGRFDRHIQVNLPDIKEREAILKIHAKNKNVSTSVSLADIARRTPGMSGAQLENVLNEATLLAVRFNKTAVGMTEIDEAIDRVIAGPSKKSRVISPEEKKQIAIHEAGHALVGLYTPGADKVEKITIIPRGRAAGYTISNPEKQEITIQKKSDLIGMVTELVGARAAEEIKLGAENVSTGASNDLYRASNIVRSMVMQLGMTSAGLTQFIPSEGTVNPYQTKLYSEQTAQNIDKQIESIMQDCYSKSKEIINAHESELDLIVETLLVLETIVKEQIDYIHKEQQLPHEVIARREELEAAKVAAEAAKEKEKAESPKEEIKAIKKAKSTRKAESQEVKREEADKDISPEAPTEKAE